MYFFIPYIPLTDFVLKAWRTISMDNIGATGEDGSLCTTSAGITWKEYEACDYEEELDKVDHVLRSAKILLIRTISPPNYPKIKSEKICNCKWYEVLDHNGERLFIVRQTKMQENNQSHRKTEFITTTYSGIIILRTFTKSFSKNEMSIESYTDPIGRIKISNCGNIKIFDPTNEVPVIDILKSRWSSVLFYMNRVFCFGRHSPTLKIYSYFEDENSKKFLGFISKQKWEIYQLQNQNLLGINFDSNAFDEITIAEKFLILGSCYALLL